MASAALAVLVAGCSSPSAAPTSTPVKTSDPVGQIHIRERGTDLSISQLVAHLDPAGNGDLTMTVHNAGEATDHLDMVAIPGGQRGTLKGGKGTNGVLDTAGIAFRINSTVAFGGSGPTVRLRDVHETTAHTLPLTLQFGVAGLVHLQARVATG